MHLLAGSYTVGCAAPRAHIDRFLHYSYALFASRAHTPYSIIPVMRAELEGLIYPQTCSALQLLIVQRTDFDRCNPGDYIMLSPEFLTMAQEFQLAYITAYKYMLMSDVEMDHWIGKAIHQAVVQLAHLALQSGLSLVPVPVDPIRLDTHLGLAALQLRAYCIFDIVKGTPAVRLFKNN